MPITYFTHFKESAAKARRQLIFVVLVFAGILCVSTFYEPGFKNIGISFCLYAIFLITGIINLIFIAPLISKKVGIVMYISMLLCSSIGTASIIYLLFEIIDYPAFVKAHLIPERTLISMYLCIGLVQFFAGRFLYLFFSSFQLSNEKLKNELDSYKNEVNSMRLQLNPNYLYNSLNSLKILLEKQKLDEALKFNTETYLLLEKQIKYAQKETILLEEDLQWIENFLKTQQLNKRNSFQFNISIADPELCLQETPPILLQPILESFIESTKDSSTTFTIEIEVSDLISNKGNGITIMLSKKEESSNLQDAYDSISMLNLKKRIALINKIGKFEIRLEHQGSTDLSTYIIQIIQKNG